MASLLVNNHVNRVDLVAEGSCSVADIVLIKNKEGIIVNEEELKKARAAAFGVINNISTEGHKLPVKTYVEAVEKACADTQKALQDKEKESEDAKKKMEDDKKKVEDDLATCKTKLAEVEKDLEVEKSKNVDTAKSKEAQEEEILKSMPESAKALFLAIKKSKEDAEAEIAKAKAEKEENEAIAKAKELVALPADLATLTAIVKSKPSKEVMTLLENIAKAAEGSELFKQQGSDQGNDNNVDAATKLDSIAKSKVEKDGISYAKAIVQAYEENPDLYSKL